MTSSRWSTPVLRRSRSSTTIWPSSGARCSRNSHVHRDVACAPAATWPSHFARTIPSSERRSTSGSGSTERATPSETCSSGGISRTSSTCKNAAAEAERKKLQAVVELFKKYGAQYDLDYLLMAAQGYQESTLDQTVKSPVGAIGVMQVMPPTGKELNVGDISKVEPNIHAGVKYMRFMMDQYFKDEPMDNLNKGLMTFAVLQRRAGTAATAPARDGEAGPRSQRVVRQRRARRLGADRPRNRHLRQQHLQVLRHLPSAHRTAGSARRGEGGGSEARVTKKFSVLTPFSRILGGSQSFPSPAETVELVHQ